MLPHTEACQFFFHVCQFINVQYSCVGASSAIVDTSASSALFIHLCYKKHV